MSNQRNRSNYRTSDDNKVTAIFRVGSDGNSVLLLELRPVHHELSQVHVGHCQSHCSVRHLRGRALPGIINSVSAERYFYWHKLINSISINGMMD